MKLKDVVKILIKHDVLLCNHIIEEDNVTRLYPKFLSKHTIKHNDILKDLKSLQYGDRINLIVDRTLKRLKEDETKNNFLERFSRE